MAVHSKLKRWSITAGIFISLIITLSILGDLFPYTGLAYIVVVPIQLIVVFAMLMLAIWLTAYLNKLWFIVYWIATWFICFSLVVSTYPQEFRPSVPNQIAYTISTIQTYDSIEMSDIYLPFTLENYGNNACAIENSLERHAVALYKYRNNISYNSNFRINSYNDVKPVKSAEDIPNHLETGQERFIWNYLSLTRE